MFFSEFFLVMSDSNITKSDLLNATSDIELKGNVAQDIDKDRGESSTVINEQELKDLLDIIDTFRSYKYYNVRKVAERVNFVDRMPKNHQELLKNYLKHLEKVRISILHNYEIIKVIVGDSAKILKNSILPQTLSPSPSPSPRKDVPQIDSVFNQIVREWCKEGSNERESCFTPIIDAIEKYFPCQENRHKINILVPGCGLGRLPFEIAKRGFSCQGNEFSLMMLLVANFILNKIDDIEVFTLYPWVTRFSNNLLNCHQTMPVKFPDVNPATVPRNVGFSMVAGSFTEIFNNHEEANQFDCLVTCFFLDTTQNIITYIEAVRNTLKPGGIWINFGPLLYHYADMLQPSIEPSYEMVREIIESFGFEFLEEKTNITTYYARIPNSMLSYEYHCVYFVCRK